MAEPRDVFTRLLDRINAGDVDGIGELLVEDHRFVDALGREVLGRDAMCEAWRGYFSLFPSYRIDAHTVISDGDHAAAFGEASGGNDHASWSTRAAWLARIDGDRIAEWTIYCDVQAQLRAMGAPID
jgi:ketosteroid isomerase-like protein